MGVTDKRYFLFLSIGPLFGVPFICDGKTRKPGSGFVLKEWEMGNTIINPERVNLYEKDIED